MVPSTQAGWLVVAAGTPARSGQLPGVWFRRAPLSQPGRVVACGWGSGIQVGTRVFDHTVCSRVSISETPMTLSSLLRIAAAAQLAIALLNLFLVRLLDWKADLARMPLLLRDVFPDH